MKIFQVEVKYKVKKLKDYIKSFIMKWKGNLYEDLI